MLTNVTGKPVDLKDLIQGHTGTGGVLGGFPTYVRKCVCGRVGRIKEKYIDSDVEV